MNDKTSEVRVPSGAEFLAGLDVEAGWPPRFKKEHSTKKETKPPDNWLKLGAAGVMVNAEMRQAHIRTIMQLPEIASVLAGRWSVLGVHQISGPSRRLFDEDRIRVCIFNYTQNKLVDVFLRNGTVERVVNGLPHQHPETAMELAQAISIARSHPDLAESVKDLVPHGILRVPANSESPSYGHRCIHVIFTQTDDPCRENRAQYSALVDLKLQRLVSMESCDCVDSSTAATQKA